MGQQLQLNKKSFYVKNIVQIALNAVDLKNNLKKEVLEENKIFVSECVPRSLCTTYFIK